MKKFIVPVMLVSLTTLSLVMISIVHLQKIELNEEKQKIVELQKQSDKQQQRVVITKNLVTNAGKAINELLKITPVYPKNKDVLVSFYIWFTDTGLKQSDFDAPARIKFKEIIHLYNERWQ
jgi:hypothetical protein